MCMFRRYLLKQKFWQVKRNGGVIYMKHDSRAGGVYARVLHDAKTGRKGVELVVDGERHFFDNFNELDEFLDSLQHRPAADPMMAVLGRRSKQAFFRQLAL
ncbi:MAG: hypothetical protein Kow0069_26110 [Promethearchaeota archaeon]